jgi:DNA-binding MarR family transcriptional regulator
MASALRRPILIDDLLLYRLSRLLGVGGSPVIRLCEGRFGITRREWRVIASLKPGGRMLSSELALLTQLDRARTSRTVSSLVVKGLLDREGVAGDLRKATVCLTEKGLGVYEALFPVVVQLNAQLVQTLSDEELTVLDKALHAMQRQAEDMLGRDDLPKADRRRGGRSGHPTG